MTHDSTIRAGTARLAAAMDRGARHVAEAAVKADRTIGAMPWLASDVTTLRRFNRKGLRLSEIANRIQHPAGECDIALWEALGRSDIEVAKIMNLRAREAMRANNPLAAA